MTAPRSSRLEPVSPAEIQSQVDALAASPMLMNSTQLCRFLRYLVDRTLADDTGSLKENLLGTAVFDRGIRYDPRTDPVVRVEARRLRAKLEDYYAGPQAQAAVIIRIPKGAYVPVFERGEGATSPALPASRTPEAAAGARSIAVLPFASVGADPETEYFSDGLTDEVISLLGHIPGLSVVSRSSVYQFKGRTGDARQTGHLLGATHLVEGSVRRDGHRLRIGAQLVEVAQGYQVWAETFERDWRQIFAIQTEIASAIASRLRLGVNGERPLPGAQRSPLYTENLEAYSALLKGRFFWNKRTVAGFQSAMEAYRQAIALDSDYAPAWAGLADCLSMLGFVNASSPAEARIQAREAAERAVALDPHLAAAHVAHGQQLAIHEWDWVGAMAALHRALELDPNAADAHYALSKTLASFGRVEEALPHIVRARQLDPLSLIVIASHGWELSLARRYEESDAAYQAARDLDPRFLWSYVLQSWSLENRGLMQEAIDSLRTAAGFTDSTVVRGELAHALGKTGQLEEARQILDQFLDRARTQYVSPFDLARAYEGLGQRDQALEAMRDACEQRSPLLLFIGADPLFDPFRSDPRFHEILRRIKLA